MIEPTKVYQPSYVSINNEAEEKTVSLWHVSPTEMVRKKNHSSLYSLLCRHKFSVQVRESLL